VCVLFLELCCASHCDNGQACLPCLLQGGGAVFATNGLTGITKLLLGDD
jgi:hypothetical protein